MLIELSLETIEMNSENSPQLPVLDLLTLDRKDAISAMVDTFQCPGCGSGLNTLSGCYKPDQNSHPELGGLGGCRNHHAATAMGGIGLINLGLPKGFNRLGMIDRSIQPSNIRIQLRMPLYNSFNIPCWALEETRDLESEDIPCPKCKAPPHVACEEGMRDSGRPHAVRTVKANFLIVNCFMPRLNQTWVDVIPGAKISDLPAPFDKTVVDVSKLDLSECS